MTENAVRLADQYFAQGDYVRALDELQKAAPSDPEIGQRIRAALERMKLIAAREFAVGRWSVAEGIVDAVQEHERFLIPAERDECRRLVQEIGRCRDREKQIHGFIEAAAALAARSQFAQSREVALQAMRTFADPQLVARLRKLLGGLPHPLGRLLYGFDSAVEVHQFVRTKGGAKVEMIMDESHAMGGGFLRVFFPTRGASVMLMDPPPDWTDYKEVGFFVRLATRGRSNFQISVGDVQSSWIRDMRLVDPYWNPWRFPLDRFEKHGAPEWSTITCFGISSLADEPVELWLDEVRLKPKEGLRP